LTLNFIDLDTFRESVEHLSLLPAIKELTLTGNPCTDWKSYSDYVIAKVPQLCRLDSTDITKSMKILAEQRLEELEKELEELAEGVRYKKAHEPVNPNAYTPENRLKDYQDEIDRKKEEERNKPKNPFEVPDEFKETRKGPPPVYHDDGEIRQCNEGRYNFKITEDDDNDRIIVELFLPKYLTTNLLDVDVNPLYVRFSVKDKITQLRLPHEIEVDKSKVERSKTTGALMVTCPTVYKRPKNTIEYKKEREEFKKREKMKQLEKEMKEKNYTKEESKQEEDAKTAKESSQTTEQSPSQQPEVVEEPYVPDFDLDELPDLE
jgi:protein TilB